MSIDPKASQKFHKGEIKNNELTLKLKKGGNNKAKRKAFQQNIKRKYQKPLGCNLILRKPLKNNVKRENELRTKESL